MDSVHVSSLSSAIELLERLRANGESDCFRGQRHCWPLKSSRARLDEAGAAKAGRRLQEFIRWARACPGLGHLEAEREIIAIAQHYGIPTSYVDFTTNPRTAAFFASHGPVNPAAPDSNGCIYHFNADEMHEAMSGFNQALKDPATLVRVHIPDLWRLQAQDGLFLHLPWRDGLMDFDMLDLVIPIRKITFPCSGQTTEHEENFYPSRKSALEILVDEYFARESWVDKAVEYNEEHPLFQRSWSWDLESKTLIGGQKPTELASWADAQAWMAVPDEYWKNLARGKGPALSIDDSEDATTARIRTKEAVVAWLSSEPQARKKIVNWHISHSAKLRAHVENRKSQNIHAPHSIEHAILRTWDGMRLLPYSDEEIAEAIGTVAALLIADFQGNPDPFRSLLGDPFIVEFGASEDTYSRSRVAKSSLRDCVRADIGSFLLLDDNASGESVVALANQTADVRIVYELDKLANVFAREVIPWQIFSPYTMHTLFAPGRLKFLGSATHHQALISAFMNNTIVREARVLRLRCDMADADLLFLMLWTKLNFIDCGEDAATIVITGFEDDTRELFEIPEAQEFCDRLVRLGFISVLRVTTIFDRNFSLPTWGAFEVFLVHLRAMRACMMPSELTTEFETFTWVLGGSSNHMLEQLHEEWSRGAKIYVPAVRAYFVPKRWQGAEMQTPDMG